MLKSEKSEALTKKFMDMYPGGHSQLRVPMDVTNHRLFIERAQGSHLYDVDGNEYIEYNGALGPNILGYCVPEWTERLKEYLDKNGTAIGSNLLFSPYDIEIAERLRKYIPCCDQVKFTMTGSDCVQAAFRIMRGVTGRQVIIRFEKHYSGWFDNVLGGRCQKDPNARPTTDFSSEGLPEGYEYNTLGRSLYAGEEVFMLPWNDFEALERTFEKYHDEIAGVHFEAVVANNEMLYPKEGFLEKIRELCDKYGAIMSIDEVITGFRVGIGGAQEMFGVTPDICTLGKALSNGFPVACIAGKHEVMDKIRSKILVPGTYSGWAFGQVAAVTTLDILAKDNFACYDKRNAVQEVLMDGLVDSARRYDIPLAITEAPGMFYTVFGVEGGRSTFYMEEDIADFRPELVKVFQQYLQEQGVFIMFGGKWYISMSHTKEDIEKTLQAADIAMKKMRDNNYKFIAE